MERKENAPSPSCCINALDVVNVAAYHYIRHPSVLQRTSGVKFATDKDTIHFRVYSNVGFVASLNLFAMIQQTV